MNDEALMALAFAQARCTLDAGEPPFGAVLAGADGTVLAAGHDMVRSSADWTRHAEIETVRAACRLHGAELTGAALFTTVEPCPMCFTAAWLARIHRIVFAASMKDVAMTVGDKQRELRVPVAQMAAFSPSPVEVRGGLLREECLALFRRAEAFASV